MVRGLLLFGLNLEHQYYHNSSKEAPANGSKESLDLHSLTYMKDVSVIHVPLIRIMLTVWHITLNKKCRWFNESFHSNPKSNNCKSFDSIENGHCNLLLYKSKCGCLQNASISNVLHSSFCCKYFVGVFIIKF